jgi:hypothetical protein
MRCIIHIVNQNGSDVMRGKVGTAGTNNSLDATQCPNKQGNIRHCKFYSQTLYSTYPGDSERTSQLHNLDVNTWQVTSAEDKADAI